MLKVSICPSAMKNWDRSQFLISSHKLFKLENMRDYNYMMLQQGLAGKGVWVATSQAKQDVDVRPSNPFAVAPSSFADLTSRASPSASSSSVRKGFFPRGLLGISPFLDPKSGLEYYMLNSLSYVYIPENVLFSPAAVTFDLGSSSI